MPELYDLDPMAQRRQEAARRSLAFAEAGEAPSEAMPEPPAAPAGAPPPAASPSAIRHEGFGGYTYLFDPVTYEISILEDPKGKVPAGYVVPKNSGPYDAILKELAGAGKLGEAGVDPMVMDAMDQAAGPKSKMYDQLDKAEAEWEAKQGNDPLVIEAMDKAAGDPSLLYDALNEGDAAFREAHPTSGDHASVDPPDGRPYLDKRLAGEQGGAAGPDRMAGGQPAGGGDVADVAEPYAPPEAPAEDGDSLEGLEARMEEIKARISEKRSKVRDKVKARRGAEATAPPAAGGGQAQAAPGGASGASYEGM
tara:strand:- start:3021 stop:3947 length:927 start_codon:yes stop_codon:yes gene_type:complete